MRKLKDQFVISRAILHCFLKIPCHLQPQCFGFKTRCQLLLLKGTFLCLKNFLVTERSLKVMMFQLERELRTLRKIVGNSW